MMNQKIENLKGKLIVSCQALPAEDIREIQKQVDLPIIGIVKRDYDDSRVYITPTEQDVEEYEDLHGRI